MVSRWCLWIRALTWRALMRIGIWLHGLTPPRPPRPTFARTVSFANSNQKLKLHFYCPSDYSHRRAAGHRYPVLVNFHGGGFTLGSATDDSRWIMYALQHVDVVVVSVSYRRAPEYPFPAAVDDGVEALLYLASHAAELGLDAARVALSGFSAGGNLAVTVPMRLRSRHPDQTDTRITVLNRSDFKQQLVRSSADLQIVALFLWYPILDFQQSREHRRAMSLMPNKTLPSFLTNLFDESYLPRRSDRASPYASPVLAPDEMLAEALPEDIFLYICEWDMLLNEGQHFARRLEGLGKKPRVTLIQRASHAWDKSPNPFRDQESVNVLYRDACVNMKATFGD